MKLNTENFLYEGKSKIIYNSEDNRNYVIKFKDTATALNGEKSETLSGKGRINLEISNIIYNYLEKNGIKSHFIRQIDDTSILVKKADIIMVEVIVRNYAAGGFSKKYNIPEGNELLNTVFEFCLKSDSLGDPMINASQITAINIATRDEINKMIYLANNINDLLIKLFQDAGIKLIDFKLEFGRHGNEIILCDEISPDSCRLWDLNTNEKLDKDRFRRDMGDVLEKYKIVLERLKNGQQQ